MSSVLRLLHVEDSPDDAALICAELESSGYEIYYKRVENAADMARALETESWDAIISDFNLPVFNGLGSLETLKASGQDIPFILVSGCVGEETAVDMMKAGMHDYVMKGNLARLAPAVERELKEVGVRRERKLAEEARNASEEILRELSMFLQNVREEERKRIARELHDELGQSLTALRMDVNWLEARPDCASPLIAERLIAMDGLISKTVDSMRRISEDLRPGMLDDLGLAAALEHHVARFVESSGIPCELDMNQEEFVADDQTATAVFRIVQESLTNVARYSGATRVAIHVEESGNEIRLSVQDNGCGFPTGTPARKRKGYGIMGMRERVRMLGGYFEITGTPGAGTRVEVHIPYRRKAVEQ